MVALVFCKGFSKEDHDIKIKYKQRKKTLKKRIITIYYYYIQNTRL